MAVERVVAVDWSGDKGPGQRKKIWAGVWTAGARAARWMAGSEAGEWADARGAGGVAGRDGAGDAADGGGDRLLLQLSGVVSAGAWVRDGVRVLGAGGGGAWASAGWPMDCEEQSAMRFWGRPHKRPAEFCGEGYRAMMRETDWENKVSRRWRAGTRRGRRRCGGSRRSRRFRLAGAGAWGRGGCGRCRGCCGCGRRGFGCGRLRRLGWGDGSEAAAGGDVYAAADGPVAKSNAVARRAYLKARRKEDALYAGLSRGGGGEGGGERGWVRRAGLLRGDGAAAGGVCGV